MPRIFSHLPGRTLLVGVLFWMMGAAPAPVAGAPLIMPIVDTTRGVVDTPLVEAAMAPASGLFATVSRELGLRLWRVERGEHAPQQLPHGVMIPPQISAIALSADGTLLAVAGPDPNSQGKRHALQLVDLARGRVRVRLDGGGGALNAIRFSPDGRSLAALAWGEEGLRVYDTNDGTLLAVDRSYASEGYALEYAVDGRLATASLDGVIRLYDARFARMARTEPTPETMPQHLAFSPDGSELAVGYAAGRSLVILSGQDLSVRHRTPEVSEGTLSAVAWGRDGRLHAAGRWKGKGGVLLRTWDEKGRGNGVDRAVGEEPISRLYPAAEGGGVFALSSQGRVWSLPAEGAARQIWSPLTLTGGASVAEPFMLVSRDGWEVQYALRQGEGVTRPLRFSLREKELREGATVVKKPVEYPPEPLSGEGLPAMGVALADGVRVVAERHGLLVQRRETHGAWSSGGGALSGTWGMLALSRDGGVLAAASFSPTGGESAVALFAVGRELTRLRTLTMGREGVHGLALTPDGTRLAVLRWGAGGVALYGVKDGARLAEDREYAAEGYAMAFASDGRLAVSGLDGLVRLYDPQLKLLARGALPHGEVPGGVAFAPDGRTLAVGALEHPRLYLLEAATLGQGQRLELKARGGFSAVAWSGGMVLAGGPARQGGGPILARWADGGRGASLPPLALSAPVVRFLEQEGEKVQALLANQQVAGIDPAAQAKAVVQMVMETDGGALRGPEVGLEMEGGPPRWRGEAVPLEPGESVKAHALSRERGVLLVGTEWRLLAMRGNKVAWTKGVSGSVRAVVLSGNGQVVVAALADRTLRWYRAADGRELAALYPEPLRREWVVWNPEGSYVASPLGGRLAGVVQSGGKPGQTVFRALDAMPTMERDGAWLDRLVVGEEILRKGRVPVP